RVALRFGGVRLVMEGAGLGEERHQRRVHHPCAAVAPAGPLARVLTLRASGHRQREHESSHPPFHRTPQRAKRFSRRSWARALAIRSTRADVPPSRGKGSSKSSDVERVRTSAVGAALGAFAESEPTTMAKPAAAASTVAPNATTRTRPRR